MTARRRRRWRFAADDHDFRTQRFCRDGRAGKQSAARNRRADNVEVRNFFQKFKRRRALSGDHAIIVVRMNQRAARGAQQFGRSGFARRQRRLAKRNFRAIGFDRAYFHLRRVARHHHPGANAAHLRRQRQRRSMISRRMRHHASGRLRLAQRKDGVCRAANFERSGKLQVLAFEVQQRARQFIERVGNHHLRFFDVRSDAAMRLPNGLQVWDRRRMGVSEALNEKILRERRIMAQLVPAMVASLAKQSYFSCIPAAARLELSYPLPTLKIRAHSYRRAGRKLMSSSERRIDTRVNIAVPLRFRAFNNPGATEQTAESENISQRGMYFLTTIVPLKVGTPVEVSLRMPQELAGRSSSEVRCVARVVHVRPQHGSRRHAGNRPAHRAL